MAAIENTFGRKKSSHIIRRRMHVDLTPMVDLGFLLITFFMLSTTLSQPNAADLVMPKDSDIKTLLKKSAVLTLMPVRNNRIDYYEGEAYSSADVKHCTYAELRSVIQNKKNKVAQVLGNRNDIVVLIDPGAGSTYKNFVDILDEIQINDVHRYFIVSR
jgi:biopolymer transport protein ExbD